jgi:pyruvate kinase
MSAAQNRYSEFALVKTKIVATVGPACAAPEQLRELVLAGVDLFRLNFAHGEHQWLAGVAEAIRRISDDLGRPIGVLGDLAGPKIRLGELPEGGIACPEGARFEFVRETDGSDPHKLTSTYAPLVDDLKVGDRLLLADGTVAMRVIEKDQGHGRVVCVVEQPGHLRSRQGINLPGVSLSTPSLTEKDREDLGWAVAHGLDYVGLSFVRSPDDIQLLRDAISEHRSERPPQIVAKIEKTEAVAALEGILEMTDAVMVARGDLGVEADIAQVPILQKRIIRMCNERRIPVITATQMLDSMQSNERPTRAEASDVANAVIDGTDAVMLSGETAIGQYPAETVSMMSRIVLEAERMVAPKKFGDLLTQPRSRATLMTEAVTLGATTAAEHLHANLLAVATRSGQTAMALSKQRSQVPILAMTDRPEVARRMCLYWGVIPLESPAVQESPEKLLHSVLEWARSKNALRSGDRLVLVATTDWTKSGKNLLLVHAIP